MQVMSWETYRKRYNPQQFSFQDGTLGFKYTVEPTMHKLGFKSKCINEFNSHGTPLHIWDKPKKAVLNYLSKNNITGELCVYHVWHVRQEFTVCIDIYVK